MLKGIAASSGIVIAKAYKLQQPQLVIERRHVEPALELEILHTAIIKTQKDIEIIKSKAVGKLSEEDIAIFDAHLMLTQDPEFTGEMEAMIKKESVNADFACQEVSQHFIHIFESMEDAYFKERAADIKDVSFRLKCHILGITLPDLSLINEEVVIVANDLTPSDTAQLNKQYIKGFATQIGGRTSHSAIMARSLEIPAVLGITGLLELVNHGDILILDALEGLVIINPNDSELKKYQLEAENYAKLKAQLSVLKDAQSVTTDQHFVELVANIGTPNDVESVLKNGGEGVGLYRTEFLYMDAKSLPSEEEQYEAYKTVLEKMSNRPVVIRTLDIGGDKELSYLPIPHEMNPFLGYRA
ncbi:MAG: phosphoenolpyruvate--protein phosphotransferase, partial [Erysipelotrichaceae bacterium]